MKYQIMTLLTLISFTSLANKPSPTNEIRTDVPPEFTIVKQNADNNFKGTLVFDPKSCQFKLIRDGVTISVVDDNFQVQFPDGRTAIGQVSDADEKNGRYACFHSLGEKPKAKGAPDWKIFGNKTELGGDDPTKTNGLVNCKARNGATVTDAISYISTKEYKANCAKDPEACRSTERKVFVKAGAGLVFFKGNEQQGSNVKRDQLKFDESYRSKCESPGKPGPKAPAAGKTPARTT